MNGRRLLLFVGVLVALGGAAAAFAPGLVAGVTLTTAAITVVGGVALLVAYLVYRDARATHAAVRRPTTPDVETRRTAGRPGRDFDRTYAAARAGVRASARTTARERLRRLAVDTLVTADGLAEADAEVRLEAGAWTDDPHAAAFFAADPPAPPRRLRLRELLGRASVFDVRFRHALAEIERIAGLHDDADDASAEEGDTAAAGDESGRAGVAP
ncbi:hypothetical protein EFA46_005755 [Halarchaeum sp. CBA1220]|uniref:DUF7269 family protein n=1 Tax=Halarchaeum sp. CBA1220 TaxID=1853682 RepID=UPI0013142175|nr:hypothetical protein [Halarchaeum sp. CBA1220]QLC33721.1 hypothetical protein EFA46_005755 [Halarchaeum sp. CBA1220]